MASDQGCGRASDSLEQHGDSEFVLTRPCRIGIPIVVGEGLP